jgi:hypothetical protein
MADMSNYRVGRLVTHVDYPGQVGKIVAASHARDRYLVLWEDPRSQSQHIRGALRPVRVVINKTG